MALIQYLKDTRGELNHVAWPTRVQTIIFTVLVILVSLFTALYLGLFDYLLTTGLGEVVEAFPGSRVAPFEFQQPVFETEPVDIDSFVPSAQ